MAIVVTPTVTATAVIHIAMVIMDAGITAMGTTVTTATDLPQSMVVSTAIRDSLRLGVIRVLVAGTRVLPRLADTQAVSVGLGAADLAGV